MTSASQEAVLLAALASRLALLDRDIRDKLAVIEGRIEALENRPRPRPKAAAARTRRHA